MPKRDPATAAAAADKNPPLPDPATNVGFMPQAGLTEDQKRAAGVSQGDTAGEHDYSPEANAGTGGTVLDTYGPGQTVEHPNVSGPTTDLVVGQAPVVPAWPMRGSAASREAYNPRIPNAINRSPVIRGVDKDPRNDPTHPDFASADKMHPDYGQPLAFHQGIRTKAPSFEELDREETGGGAPVGVQAQREQTAATQATE